MNQPGGSDKVFLKEIISDFVRLLAFNDPGYFGKLFMQALYESEATIDEAATLSLHGTMAYIYIYIYKEPFPSDPTPEQQDRINKIWIELYHPENIVIV